MPGFLWPRIVLSSPAKTRAWRAYYPSARKFDLASRLADRETLITVRRPAGQTPESAAAMAAKALEMEGAGYDLGALLAHALGFDSPPDKENWLQDPHKWFCAELVAHVLKQTSHLRRSPAAVQALFARHSSRWRPHDLMMRAALWEN